MTHQPPTHPGDAHPAAAMGIGGAGTGGLAIGSDGGLRQWQLHNVGHHTGDLPGSFFALRVQRLEPTISSTMVLQQARPEALSGQPQGRHTPGGAVPMITDDLVPAWQRELLSERRSVTRASLSGSYPLAQVDYDTGCELDVRLLAFNPMRPWDEASNEWPTALFDFELINRSDTVTRVWLAGSLQNAVGLDPHLNPVGVRAAGYGGNTNTVQRGTGWTHLRMENHSLDPLSPRAGTMALSCSGDAVSALTQFEQPGELLDFLDSHAPWGDQTRAGASGQIPQPQRSGIDPRFGPSPTGSTWLGALVSRVELAPGQSTHVRLAISWSFPNRTVDFVQFGPDRPEHGATAFWLGNHYSRQWPEAITVATRVEQDFDELLAMTRGWTQTLEAMPIDRRAVHHLAAQAATLRSPTVFRTHDGAWYGFEGVLGASSMMWSGDVGGSCPLNCTHVWNYAQAASALLPALEADMRRTELDVMAAPQGYVPHRVYLPSYLTQLWDMPIGGPERPALDGMLGVVLKTYRELRSGALPLSWVRARWPTLVRLMDHVAQHWDPTDSGILRGEQPSTHDIGLNGANSYMGTLWLAALRAAEELARLLDEPDRADAWHDRFERSSRAYDELLFRDGHYIQIPDPELGDEHQWGSGVLSDQLIGQWWAHLLDLGHLLPAEHVREALRTVVRHNLRDADESTHVQRAYAVAGERGLVMCSWPHGGRPAVPTSYCDEVWTGSEYQVAAHCLAEGLTEQAEAILDALWTRHDGRLRNPFNEVECGDHYARSMAGWSLLELGWGARWNALTGQITVPGEGSFALLTGTGWGQVEVTDEGVRVLIRGGRVPALTVLWHSVGNNRSATLTPLAEGDSGELSGRFSDRPRRADQGGRATGAADQEH